MLKKLRIKFILLNMATVAVVLVAVFSGICYISYTSDVATVRSAISKTLDKAERLPLSSLIEGTGQQSESESGQSDSQQSSDLKSKAQNGKSARSLRAYKQLEIGQGRTESESLIPIAAYAFVTLDDDSLVALPSITTATLSDSALQKAALYLKEKPVGEGELSDMGLIYQKREANGIMLLAFADESAVDGWKHLAFILGFVGAGTLALFFLISLAFSAWALKPVDAAWKQQRQFIADASHELKTPLTVILANASIMQSHPESTVGEVDQWVSSTQSEAHRMQNLVNDMLELARSDAEKESNEPSVAERLKQLLPGRLSEKQTDAQAAPDERLNFTDLIEGCLLQFESVAFERGVEIQADELSPGIEVRGDRDQLQRLAAILMDNACKYSPVGGLVSVALVSDDFTAKLSVTNTGAVIPEDDLPHIFDRFYRADKARTFQDEQLEQSPTGGFGLGLAIAKDIAAKHFGNIGATSSSKEGTTFTVTLPLA